MDIDLIKLKLSKFGAVKTAKQINSEVFLIMMGDGFTTKATDTFKFMNLCTELLPQYPKVSVFITEQNLALLVLTT